VKSGRGRGDGTRNRSLAGVEKKEGKTSTAERVVLGIAMWSTVTAKKRNVERDTREKTEKKEEMRREEIMKGTRGC
jgi:hypothetical protein